MKCCKQIVPAVLMTSIALAEQGKDSLDQVRELMASVNQNGRRLQNNLDDVIKKLATHLEEVAEETMHQIEDAQADQGLEDSFTALMNEEDVDPKALADEIAMDDAEKDTILELINDAQTNGLLSDKEESAQEAAQEEEAVVPNDVGISQAELDAESEQRKQGDARLTATVEEEEAKIKILETSFGSTNDETASIQDILDQTNKVNELVTATSDIADQQVAKAATNAQASTRSKRRSRRNSHAMRFNRGQKKSWTAMQKQRSKFGQKWNWRRHGK